TVDSHAFHCGPCLVYLFTLSVCFVITAPARSGIYTLSLHDALPILIRRKKPRRAMDSPSKPGAATAASPGAPAQATAVSAPAVADRKSTRLNSSHVKISYAVFCLKKKKHLLYS